MTIGCYIVTNKPDDYVETVTRALEHADNVHVILTVDDDGSVRIPRIKNVRHDFFGRVECITAARNAGLFAAATRNDWAFQLDDDETIHGPFREEVSQLGEKITLGIVRSDEGYAKERAVRCVDGRPLASWKGSPHEYLQALPHRNYASVLKHSRFSETPKTDEQKRIKGWMLEKVLGERLDERHHKSGFDYYTSSRDLFYYFDACLMLHDVCEGVCILRRAFVKGDDQDTVVNVGRMILGGHEPRAAWVIYRLALHLAHTAREAEAYELVQGIEHPTPEIQLVRLVLGGYTISEVREVFRDILSSRHLSTTRIRDPHLPTKLASMAAMVEPQRAHKWASLGQKIQGVYQ